MTDLAKIHDDCLEYENELSGSIEELTELRCKFYENKNPIDIQYIMPVLNCIIHEAKEYKDFILTKIPDILMD